MVISSLSGLVMNLVWMSVSECHHQRAPLTHLTRLSHIDCDNNSTVILVCTL